MNDIWEQTAFQNIKFGKNLIFNFLQGISQLHDFRSHLPIMHRPLTASLIIPLFPRAWKQAYPGTDNWHSGMHLPDNTAIQRKNSLDTEYQCSCIWKQLSHGTSPYQLHGVNILAHAASHECILKKKSRPSLLIEEFYQYNPWSLSCMLNRYNYPR